MSKLIDSSTASDSKHIRVKNSEGIPEYMSLDSDYQEEEDSDYVEYEEDNQYKGGLFENLSCLRIFMTDRLISTIDNILVLGLFIL